MMLARALKVWGIVRRQRLYELAPPDRRTRLGRLLLLPPGGAADDSQLPRGQRLRLALEALGRGRLPGEADSGSIFGKDFLKALILMEDLGLAAARPSGRL